MGRCRWLLRLVMVTLQKQWFMLLWTMMICWLFLSSYQHYKKQPQYYYLRGMLGVGVCISRGTASVLNMGCLAAVLPMCRSMIHCITHRLMNHQPSESRQTSLNMICNCMRVCIAPITDNAKTTHLIIAATVVVASVVHSCSHIMNAINFSRHYNKIFPEINAATYKGESPVIVVTSSVTGVTGLLMLVLMMILVITSLPCTRRKNYEVFYYTHHFGIFTLLLLLFIHPYSGILKQQNNLRLHRPGCYMPKKIIYKYYEQGFSTHRLKPGVTSENLTTGQINMSEIGSDISLNLSQSQSELKISYPELKEYHDYSETKMDIGYPETRNISQHLETTSIGYSKSNDNINYTELPKNVKLTNLNSTYDSVMLEADNTDNIESLDYLRLEHLKYKTGVDTMLKGVHFIRPSDAVQSSQLNDKPNLAEPKNVFLEMKEKIGRLKQSENIILPEANNTFIEYDFPYPEPDYSEHNSGISYSDRNFIVKMHTVHHNSDYINGINNKQFNNNFNSILMEPYNKTTNTKGIKNKDTNFYRKLKKKYFKRMKRSKCKSLPVFVRIGAQTWMWVCAAIGAWVCELTCRWWKSDGAVKILSVIHYPCHVIQLNLLSPSFTCCPGQYVLVNCPNIARYQWHPFTIAEVANERKGTFTIFIRAQGDWGSRLRLLLYGNKSTTTDADLLQKCFHKYKCTKTVRNDIFTTKYYNYKVQQNFRTNNIYSKCKNLSLDARQNHYHSSSCLLSESQYTLSQNKDILYYRTCKQYNLSVTNKKNVIGIIAPSFQPITADILPVKSVSLINSTSEMYSNLLDANHECSSHLNDEFTRRVENNYPNILKPLITKHYDSNKLKSEESSYIIDMSQEHVENKCGYETVSFIMDPDIRLQVIGPFSSPHQSMTRYPIIIAAVAGMGVTPLVATITTLLKNSALKNPKRLHIVWIVRDIRMFLPLAPILSEFLEQSWASECEDRVELRLHVTKLYNINNITKHFRETFPILNPRLYSGRPNWKFLFKQWRQSYTKNQNVGVFACGPKGLCRQIQRHCICASALGYNLIYHNHSFS